MKPKAIPKRAQSEGKQTHKVKSKRNQSGAKVKSVTMKSARHHGEVKVKVMLSQNHAA